MQMRMPPVRAVRDLQRLDQSNGAEVRPLGDRGATAADPLKRLG